MRSRFLPLVAFFSVLVILTAGESFESEQLSAYEVLESYGFPGGLLPSFVQDYTLESDGKFVVHLDGTCRVNIPDAYPVKYSSKITGRISDQRLGSLKGITVKVFFFWWNIDTITVSGSDLSFEVGPFSASYPISNFSEYPDCEGRVSELRFALG